MYLEQKKKRGFYQKKKRGSLMYMANGATQLGKQKIFVLRQDYNHASFSIAIPNWHQIYWMFHKGLKLDMGL